MHEEIVVSKIDRAIEIFDLTRDGLRHNPDCKPLRMLHDRIRSITTILSKYEDRTNDMIDSHEVNKAFRGVFDLKEKFDLWVYDSFRENRNWYVAANIISEAGNALDEQTLSQHVMRECLKKRMKPWEAVCATNCVMEKDLVKIGEAQRVYMALQLAGTLKK